MELEDLKNTWTALDNRLGNREILNDRIVKEIIQLKTNKALNFLNRFEFLGAILCFISLPFLVFLLGQKAIKISFWGNVMCYFALGVVCIGCIIQSCKLWLLWKIDLNSSISKNIHFFRKYQLFIQKEKMISCILLPVLFVLVTLEIFHIGKMPLWRWAIIISALIVGILITVWQYKTIYGAKIRAIKKNLDELKELEAETE